MHGLASYDAPLNRKERRRLAAQTRERVRPGCACCQGGSAHKPAPADGDSQ